MHSELVSPVSRICFPAKVGGWHRSQFANKNSFRLFNRDHLLVFELQRDPSAERVHYFPAPGSCDVSPQAFVNIRARWVPALACTATARLESRLLLKWENQLATEKENCSTRSWMSWVELAGSVILRVVPSGLSPVSSSGMAQPAAIRTAIETNG